jgi:hypothetical protein
METTITDALKIARISLQDWHNTVGRGLYPVAPATRQGKPAVFTLLDLTAAYVLGQLLEREVVARFAASIATQVHRQIAKQPDIETVYAWKVMRTGKPRVVVAATAPQPGAIQLFEFNIAKIQAELKVGIAAAQSADQAKQ